MTLPVWTATTAYALGARATPVTVDGTVWLVETAGTSAGAEPTWPTIAPWTVTDGTVHWGLASSLRAKSVAGVYSVLTNFRTANPTLLKGLWRARPKSMTNLDLPGAFLGPRTENVTHTNQIRTTSVSIPVTLVVPVPDNAEAELVMDDLMDGIRDALTLGFHATSGYSITEQSSAGESDEPEGGVPYLANTILISVTAAEGRQ